MKMKPNLEAYFERIGYTGSRIPTLDTLRQLQKLHPQAIPFENLNPLLGIPVKLDLESLQQKMIHDNRGGYCFEHNLLFRHMLQELGFEVEGLGARVLWNRPENSITPRTHMLLLITIGDVKYISDVGFGGQTPTAPLQLESEKVQDTLHEPFCLVRHRDDNYILKALVKEEWKALYRFDLQPQFSVDYEVAHWYVSQHPGSHFVTELIVSRTQNEPYDRFVLHNNTFARHSPKGETERHTIGSPTRLREILENIFHLHLPEVENLGPTLERLTIDKQREPSAD